jgi:hypothetical protein
MNVTQAWRLAGVAQALSAPGELGHRLLISTG